MGGCTLTADRCGGQPASVALVLYCAIAPLAYVPEHSGWIPYIGDSEAPWLHGWCVRGLDIEFSGQIERFNVRPPGVEVVDHELHHEIFSPVFLISALKYEAAGAGFEDRDIAVEEFFEAQGLVEFFGEIEIFCGHEWAGEFCPAWNLLHFFPP